MMTKDEIKKKDEKPNKLLLKKKNIDFETLI